MVSKETGEAIPGASIVIKGTTIGRVSDRDGTFTLVDDDPTIKADGSLSTEVVVSFVGMKTVVNNISASGSGVDKAKYTFKMEEAIQVLYNPNYSGEQMIPPPPPPPPAAEREKPANGETPPPPPPPVADSEKEVFFVVEDIPKYPGGFGALQEQVAKMQKKLAREKNLKGKATVTFTVNAKGKVSDIKVVEKDNDAAAKGAFAIANELEDWKPGKQRGKAVPVKYMLPVEFK
nr:energy transducer TonB [uncultured Draconibacterium sp.]